MALRVQEQDLSDDIKRGLRSSVKYLTTRLLSEKHWTRIGEALANRWDRFQSLTAAIKLMEQHGVKLTPQEEERLSQMNESQMIETLVMKMPQQSKEEFQNFFLQLQLIVSTAMRVRQALEAGQPGMVEQALNDADSTGIAEYTLKMAIVQAGVETLNLQRQHEGWARDAEAKMSRLVRGQEEAAMAKARLAKAQSQLAVYTTAQNEHIKKVLMTFAGGSATALMHGVFSGWNQYTKKMVQENMIYEEYRERLEFAEKRLFTARSDSLKLIAGVMEKKGAASEEALLAEVFHAWADDYWEAKNAEDQARQVAEMEARLQALNSRQADQAKKVMARMGAMADFGMRDICFHEWANFHKEYKKNKEFEDRVKDSENRIAQFMKDKSSGAKSILAKAAGATDTGLLHATITAWYQYYLDEKRSNEMALQMQQNANKFSLFGDRFKSGATNVMETAAEHNITMLNLKVMSAWKLATKVDQLLREHGIKIDGKRQQLMGVQQMFRNFAVQLETSIRSSQVDDDDLTKGVPAKYRQKHALSQSQNSVSLPDIHALDRHGSSNAQTMPRQPARDSGWR